MGNLVVHCDIIHQLYFHVVWLGKISDQGVACSGAGGQDGGLGVRSALGDESAPENGATERGFLAIWTLLASSLFSVVLSFL